MEKKPSEIESRIVSAEALTFYINLDRAKKTEYNNTTGVFRNS